MNEMLKIAADYIAAKLAEYAPDSDVAALFTVARTKGRLHLTEELRQLGEMNDICSVVERRAAAKVNGRYTEMDEFLRAKRSAARDAVQQIACEMMF